MPFDSLVPDVMLPDLTLGTGLLLTGFRGSATHGGPCACVDKAFARAFQGEEAPVLARLLMFARMLGYHGRRKIRLAPPGSPRVTDDELLIAALMEGAQLGDKAIRDGHLGWLLAAPAPDPLSALAQDLADQFSAAGQRITAPVQSMVRRPHAPDPWHAHAAGHA